MAPVLTHIALHVRDLDACVAFYRDFCGLTVAHQRADDTARTVWMAEPGKEREFVFVLLSGGAGHRRVEPDFGHLGFALDSREAVDAVALRAAAVNCLVWQPTQAPHPVGYFCGLKDPDGNYVEFSYGQPLGPDGDAGAASDRFE